MLKQTFLITSTKSTEICFVMRNVVKQQSSPIWLCSRLLMFLFDLSLYHSSVFFLKIYSFLLSQVNTNGQMLCCQSNTEDTIVCLLISTQDISQTHISTIKITTHINKPKQNIIILMLYLIHSRKKQWAFKKRSSVPWIVAYQ